MVQNKLWFSLAAGGFLAFLCATLTRRLYPTQYKICLPTRVISIFSLLVFCVLHYSRRVYQHFALRTRLRALKEQKHADKRTFATQTRSRALGAGGALLKEGLPWAWHAPPAASGHAGAAAGERGRGRKGRGAGVAEAGAGAQADDSEEEEEPNDDGASAGDDGSREAAGEEGVERHSRGSAASSVSEAAGAAAAVPASAAPGQRLRRGGAEEV